jgi:hypothetical protein
MENSTSLVLDDKEAVEHAEGQRGNREEVEGGNHFAVVVEERKPTLRPRIVRLAFESLQIARDGGLGNLESESQQFAMDSRGAPRMDSRTSCDGLTAGLPH